MNKSMQKSSLQSWLTPLVLTSLLTLSWAASNGNTSSGGFVDEDFYIPSLRQAMPSRFKFLDLRFASPGDLIKIRRSPRVHYDPLPKAARRSHNLCP